MWHRIPFVKVCKLIVQKTFRIRLGIFWNSYAHSTDVLYPGGIVVNFWIHAGYKSSVFIVWEVLNLVWEVFFMHDLQRRIGRTSRSFVIGYYFKSKFQMHACERHDYNKANQRSKYFLFFKTFWRRLQGNNFSSSKTSSRPLQVIFKKCLQDVFSWRLLQDVLQTCLEDVVEGNKMLAEDGFNTYSPRRMFCLEVFQNNCSWL